MTERGYERLLEGIDVPFFSTECWLHGCVNSVKIYQAEIMHAV